MRLGFSAQVLGRPQLKSHDARRWQNAPHLSVSLAYLRDILLYLQETGIRMYRMHADLAPYVTHPDLPQLHRQIEECATELGYVGQLAREADIRLSFHADTYTVLNAAEPEIAARGAHKLTALAAILDAMGLGAEAVIVLHVGGLFGDKAASLERFLRVYERLPEACARRLALENDESRYHLGDTYRLHQQMGLPLVLDRLHFLLNNPDHLSMQQALSLALGTWPAGVMPKVHFSSPRTEMKAVPDLPADEEADTGTAHPPLWTNHSDYINPFEFLDFVRLGAGGRTFDVMLEARGKDLAVLRLRRDLARFAPELA